MIYPDGIRRTRLFLIAEEQPGAYHRSLDGVEYEVRPLAERYSAISPVRADTVSASGS